jgi:phage shock protein A
VGAVGVLSRMSTIFKSKMNQVLDQVEDPRQTLEYSYERQLELLQQVKRGLADVVASKKRVELQSLQLQQQAKTLEDQAKQALTLNREDLARAALERKAAIQSQIDALGPQMAEIEAEQQKLEVAEQRLTAKVEAFRTQKELVKAQYTAAQAQVKIGEAVNGLGEEMADVGLAMQRAQDKTQAMKARAAAIDELVDKGDLTDLTAGSDPIAAQLRQAQASRDVEADLARLRQEVGKGS